MGICFQLLLGVYVRTRLDLYVFVHLVVANQVHQRHQMLSYVLGVVSLSELILPYEFFAVGVIAASPPPLREVDLFAMTLEIEIRAPYRTMHRFDAVIPEAFSAHVGGHAVPFHLDVYVCHLYTVVSAGAQMTHFSMRVLLIALADGLN